MHLATDSAQTFKHVSYLSIPKHFASYVSPQRVKYVALSVALKIEILCTFQPGGLGPEPPNKGINLFAVCSTYVVVLAQADLASGVI